MSTEYIKSNTAEDSKLGCIFLPIYLTKKSIIMTTNTITIQDFVSRAIIYCVSSLVYTLNKEGKLDEEYWNLLNQLIGMGASRDTDTVGESNQEKLQT